MTIPLSVSPVAGRAQAADARFGSGAIPDQAGRRHVRETFDRVSVAAGRRIDKKVHCQRGPKPVSPLRLVVYAWGETRFQNSLNKMLS
jgi:hypothetical protein